MGCGVTCGDVELAHDLTGIYLDGTDVLDADLMPFDLTIWTGDATLVKRDHAVDLYTERAWISGRQAPWTSDDAWRWAKRAPDAPRVPGLLTLTATGCLTCPDLTLPDSAAYRVTSAEEYMWDSGFGLDRLDVPGGLIIEEGDDLTLVYLRTTGERVEVTWRRAPTDEADR